MDRSIFISSCHFFALSKNKSTFGFIVFIFSVCQYRYEAFVVFFLYVSVIGWVKVHHPFNTVFISEHTKIGTPWAVRNRHFNLSAH